MGFVSIEICKEKLGIRIWFGRSMNKACHCNGFWLPAKTFLRGPAGSNPLADWEIAS
jgi:hypothetical protein